jgi:hypothetical protein
MNRPEIVRFVSAEMTARRLTAFRPVYRSYTLAGHESVGYHEVLLIWPRKRGKEEYISPHWSEPNVIVHVRFSDYGDTLLVEEIQSDWQLPEALQSEPIKRVASMMASGMNLRDAMDSLYSESPRDAISVARVFGGKFTKPKTTSEEVNAIDITPAMRESVMFVGQPVMERQAPYGEIRWRTPTPSEFVAARDRSKRIGYLSPLGPDDLAGYRLFLSEDGTVGFSIDPNGDIQNVFNNGGPKRIGGTTAGITTTAGYAPAD